METLEVVRRWIWVFFRMESEWVRKGHSSFGGMRSEYEADNEYALVSTGASEREGASAGGRERRGSSAGGLVGLGIQEEVK